MPKLEDVLTTGLDLVICGTAASSVSAERGQDYAGPGNRFWTNLWDTGLTDRLLEPSEYRSLLDYGKGLRREPVAGATQRGGAKQPI